MLVLVLDMDLVVETAAGLIADHVIHNGNSVAWVDCERQDPPPLRRRVTDVLKRSVGIGPRNLDNLERITVYRR